MSEKQVYCFQNVYSHGHFISLRGLLILAVSCEDVITPFKGIAKLLKHQQLSSQTKLVIFFNG